MTDQIDVSKVLSKVVLAPEDSTIHVSKVSPKVVLAPEDNAINVAKVLVKVVLIEFRPQPVVNITN